MATPHKNLQLVLIGAILAVCAVSFIPVVLFAESIHLGKPVCGGGGNWTTFDTPDLKIAWQNLLEQANLGATGLSAYGEGETSMCTVQTLLGPSNYLQSPSTASLNVSATIPVEDLTDDTLGNIVLKIVEAAQQNPSNQAVFAAGIDLTFTNRGNSKSVGFYPQWVNEWHKQGLTAAQIFATIDKRYTPPTPALASPTRSRIAFFSQNVSINASEPAALYAINTGTLNGGLTQFRLYFGKDDNNNHAENTIKFLSGNSASNQPILEIIYTLP